MIAPLVLQLSTTPVNDKKTKSIPLDRYLSGHWRRRTLRIGAAVVALAVLVVADRAGWLLYDGGDWVRYEGASFTVVRVVDGDTLQIAVPDADQPVTRVRLWGVDAPELARPDRGRQAQPFANRSAERVGQLCDDKVVRLYLESHKTRGKYGRLLAYVELPDGTLLNERLLIEGLARADGRFSHRWVQRFAMLETQARHDRVGIWSDKK